MRLFINDIELELEEGTRIARTKQVNDIGNLSNRQSNYTQKIKVPKTKNNIKALDHLWSAGNTSRIPYQKNTAQLINDSGVHEIYNGIATVFDSTSEYYNISIYDGYVSFVKAIENFSLNDLDVSELNHLKNLTNVLATYTDDTLNYRYNVADYNGKMFTGGYINIDYLIPSVNKKYLWDKIFDFFGFTYSGSVFDTEDFINNWMTYPKPIGDGTQVTTAIHTWDWNGTEIYQSPEGSLNFRYSDYFTHDPLIDNSYAYSSPVGSDNSPAGGMITVYDAGLYKFTFSGTIGYFEKQGETTDNPIYIRHGFFSSAGDSTTEILNDNFIYGEPFEFIHYQQLQAGERFQIGGARPMNANLNDNTYTGQVDVEFEIVEGNAVDFEEALLDFNIKDFVDEILWEFSLTPFKDKYTNNITFLTHEEWLQTTDIYDYSSNNTKFVSKEKEKYILSGYAQKNHLKHKYNDDNANYNDGSLNILNENLKEHTTIIQSKVYTPEKNKSNALGFETNVYKIWEKEVEDDGSVSYKDLEKRFYFMRSEYTQRTRTFGSETEGLTQTISGYYSESYDRMRFNDIVERYYKPLYSILNTSKINTSKIYYNDIDISELDFKKLVYIKELGSYYMLNKISNYSNKGVYNTELIEVDYRDTASFEVLPDPLIILSSTAAEPNGVTQFNWIINNNYTFLNYTPDSATIYAKQIDGDLIFPVSYTGLEYTDTIVIADTVINIDMPLPLSTSEGWYEVYIEDGDGLQSNYEYVFVGSSDIATPNIEAGFEVIGANFSQHERVMNYRFNNFMPLTASASVQQYDIINGVVIGTVFTETLMSLLSNTDLSQQLTIPDNFGFVRLTITTDTINFQQTFALY